MYVYLRMYICPCMRVCIYVCMPSVAILTLFDKLRHDGVRGLLANRRVLRQQVGILKAGPRNSLRPNTRPEETVHDSDNYVFKLDFT